MSEKLEKVREKLQRHMKKMAVGVALATTLVACGEKKDKTFTFDAQKDYQTMIYNTGNNTLTDLQIPEKTFQLDSLEAVTDIASRIPSSIVDKQDKNQVATTIYNNINSINRMTEGLERPTLNRNDSVLHGTKGYGYTTSGYDNPKFNDVRDKESDTIVTGKKDTYDISVETPYGYSGRFAHNLRSERVSQVMAKNRAKDQSWAGVYR